MRTNLISFIFLTCATTLTVNAQTESSDFEKTIQDIKPIPDAVRHAATQQGTIEVFNYTAHHSLLHQRAGCLFVTSLTI